MRFVPIIILSQLVAWLEERLGRAAAVLKRLLRQAADRAFVLLRRLKDVASRVRNYPYRQRLRRLWRRTKTFVENHPRLRNYCRVVGVYAGYILVYGALVMVALHTLFGATITPENVVGAGAAYYLVEDLARVVIHGEE